MKYIYQEGNKDRPVLLLLHGTGGDENSLLALAEIIDPEASVLSVRGNILEHGMPRFFRRLAEGIFDMEDLAFRTKELHEFLNEVAKEHYACILVGIYQLFFRRHLACNFAMCKKNGHQPRYFFLRIALGCNH